MSYFPSRLPQLLSQPCFREAPIQTLARSAIWLACCAVGYSPQFRLADGVRFVVDPVLRQSGSTSAFVLRQWAEPELRYLDQLLPIRGTFIDCGANIGIYTARAAGIVGERGKVISIEPGDLSFTRLSRNVDLNGFSQVELVRKAISDQKSTARLYHADGGPVAFSLAYKEGAEFEEVETTTIDDLMAGAEVDRADCLKLDVEGFELAALRGARNTLSRMHPTVIFERTSYGARRLGVEDEVSSFLISLGYKLHRFGGDSSARFADRSPNIVAIHPECGRTVPRIFTPWTPDKTTPPDVDGEDNRAI